MRSRYARLLAEGRPADRSGCVTPEALEALATGRAADTDRLAWLRHVGGCVACREELDLLRATVAAGRGLQPLRSAWLKRAAAVVLLVTGTAVLWRSAARDPSLDVLRGDRTGLELLAPVGEVARADLRILSWRPAGGGAPVYQLELLDQNGRVSLRAETTDTVVPLPDSLVLVSGVEYRWWVRARMEDGSSARSEFQAFRITR